jgi:hypothetical protein
MRPEQWVLGWLQDALQGPFTALCGTWNVGNANPPEDLSAWLERPQQLVP